MSDQAVSGDRPEFDPEQEVRFAVVMYGGVSLAIYINGVAQELYRLVRSTAPAHEYAENKKVKGVPPRLYLADAALKSSDRVYRDLAKRIPAGRAKPAAAESGKVRTRFVVDILSGTSAGGINSVLLGLALALQKDFTGSARLWREVADIGELLREKGSNQKLDPVPNREPLSLLNGYHLYLEARDAMEKMEAQTPEDKWHPAYVEQLDLAVTATDLDGLPLPIRLTHETSIRERTHRTVFRFTHGTEDAIGEYHTDFENFDDQNLELMLGFAARATSSFPFAFEPVLLKDLTDLPREKQPGIPEPGIDPKMVVPVHARNGAKGLDKIAFADGGYLDNKPFSYATEALRSRRADLPVERKLVYIEPHPIFEAPEEPPRPGEKPKEKPDRPGVFGNVRSAMSLPRHETIREDVAAVGRRNLAVARLRDLGLQAERAADAGNALENLKTLPDRPPNSDAEKALGSAGPTYAAYRSLRVRTVLDGLAELRAELCGAEPDGQLWEDTREALRKWIEDNHETTHAAFLEDYDTVYEKRRLSFLQDRVNDLLRRDARAVRMLAVADVFQEGSRVPNSRQILNSPRDPAEDDPAFAAVATALRNELGRLRDLKVALNEAADALRKAERAPRSRRPDELLGETQHGRFNSVKSAAAGAVEDVDEFMQKVKDFYAAPLQEMRAGIDDALEGKEDDWVRGLLRLYNRRVQSYDMIMLPLSYPDLGERNAVEIVRISPEDAAGIKLAALEVEEGEETKDPATKLAGIRVGHFGGFLERAWRDNDLLWGRLDAADVIVRSLVSAGPERDAFRESAQAAILREELAGRSQEDALKNALGEELAADPEADPGADAALVAAFAQVFTLPAELTNQRTDELSSRSIRIAGRVLAETPDTPRWLKGPLRGLSLVGPGVARVALPATRTWAKAKEAPGKLLKRARGLWPFGKG
jgi:patatin-related protein